MVDIDNPDFIGHAGMSSSDSFDIGAFKYNSQVKLDHFFTLFCVMNLIEGVEKTVFIRNITVAHHIDFFAETFKIRPESQHGPERVAVGIEMGYDEDLLTVVDDLFDLGCGGLLPVKIYSILTPMLTRYY